MPALSYRQNYANRDLYPHTRGIKVGVRMASGEAKYFRWLGFIDVETAKLIDGAKPVKLIASRYSNDSAKWAAEWTDLKEGEYVQGCLTTEGVYAVIETVVRIVR